MGITGYADRFNELMRAQGLNARVVYDLIERRGWIISEQTIYNLAKGITKEPTPQLVWMITQVLGVEMEALDPRYRGVSPAAHSLKIIAWQVKQGLSAQEAAAELGLDLPTYKEYILGKPIRGQHWAKIRASLNLQDVTLPVLPAPAPQPEPQPLPAPAPEPAPEPIPEPLPVPAEAPPVEQAAPAPRPLPPPPTPAPPPAPPILNGDGERLTEAQWAVMQALLTLNDLLRKRQVNPDSSDLDMIEALFQIGAIMCQRGGGSPDSQHLLTALDGLINPEQGLDTLGMALARAFKVIARLNTSKEPANTPGTSLNLRLSNALQLALASRKDV